MTEVWKSIPGFDGYEASDMGNIKSYRKRGRYCKNVIGTAWRLLRGGITHGGYAFVFLMDNGTPKRRKVAHLILLTFVGARPDNMEVCHGNNIKLDNRLENLRYDTRLGNRRDGCHLTDVQIIEMRERRAAGDSTVLLSKDYGMSSGRVWSICAGNIMPQIGGPRTSRSTAPRRKPTQETATGQ